MGLKKISKLKKELDKWFSLYIRLRGADDNGNNQCCTCGTVDNWKKLQCGHFVSRKHLATRFHEMNCFPQCVSCNIFKYGEQWKFGQFLDRNLGEGVSEELVILGHTILKISRIDYEEKITYYKSVVNKIKLDKNLE
tara:strand:+ start:1943 stop:2353 length:411 start_codon:yes stop_codon:yes gene_type:complete